MELSIATTNVDFP